MRSTTLIALVIGLAACESPPGIESARRSLGGGLSPVIIHFSRQVDLPALASKGRAGRPALIQALRADAARAQAGALALLKQHGVTPGAKLWLINARAAKVPSALLGKLAALPDVERIEPDLLTQAPKSSGGQASATPWNLSAIGASSLWAAGQRGGGTVVASLDTGVDAAHPDLSASWRSTAGWFDPYDQHATPFDATGHGTQVMGLIVGGSSSGRPIGVAPEAQWIAAKIYDDGGNASLGAIHQALQWTLDPDGDPGTDDAADVVNGSWGFSDLANQCYLEFEEDLAALRAAQIAVVFSAGNSGPSTLSSLSPANNPSSFAAGGVDETLAVVASSSRGPDACTGGIFPELVAPGANVHTTDRTFGGVFPDSYIDVTGTSFAASHVTGAMALLRGAHSTATVAQIEEALTGTAADLGASGADNESGCGLPDLAAAETRLAALVSTPSCTDGDGDGYFAEPDCGTALDCDDASSSVNPGACDIKGDGIDQDCNGADRLKGKSCPSSGGDTGGGGSDGGSTSGAEGKGKTCSDGQDNDGDGLVDCLDPDCARAKGC